MSGVFVYETKITAIMVFQPSDGVKVDFVFISLANHTENFIWFVGVCAMSIRFNHDPMDFVSDMVTIVYLVVIGFLDSIILLVDIFGNNMVRHSSTIGSIVIFGLEKGNGVNVVNTVVLHKVSYFGVLTDFFIR